MSYIIKQKLNIQDFVSRQKADYRVVIHEPEEYLSALYGHYLRERSFNVKHCPSLESVVDLVRDFTPRLLIFSIEFPENPSVKAKWLLKFKNDFPEVCIITTGFNTGTDVLKLLLHAGISSHLNRKLTRPQDIAIIAKHLLN